MRYSDKFPNATYGRMVNLNIMYTNHTDSCAHCGMPTNFIDIDFKAYVCSEECESAITDEFFKYAKDMTSK